MNTALTTIEGLMAHPAPGLVFGTNEQANLPRRAYPTHHAWGGVMSEQERRELTTLVAGSVQLGDLLELYQRANGVHFFYLKCPHCDEPHWALSLLPVSDWSAATSEWKPGGDCAYFMEGCDLYSHGEWRVIASTPSESMRLVQFFSGEHRGEQLAGKIFCIGLDGYLGFEEEVAPSLSALMQEITRDPVAFFNRIGFGWSVGTDLGCFGDTMEQYIPDMRDHPNAATWPPTRPR
jgi:hypothetical protein